MNEPVWILYVARDKRQSRRRDRGSHISMRIIDEHGLTPLIAIQDVSVMRERHLPIPELVRGTPTLVHRTTHQSYEGTDAILEITQLASSASRPARIIPDPQKPPPSSESSSSSAYKAVERELPHPTRPPAGRQVMEPTKPAVAEDDDDPLALKPLLDHPPEDDGLDNTRVTEAEVQALMDKRRAFDRSLE